MTGKTSWTFGLPIEQTINPTIYMDFPNVTGTRVYYTGTPTPPPPPPPPPITHTTNNWKWQKSKKFNIYY